MFRLLIIALTMAFAPAAIAAPPPPPVAVAPAGETVTLEVKGMVCDFCSRSIEKVFLQKAKAQAVKIDLDHGRVTIVMPQGAVLNDALAKKLILDSGFNLVAISRSAPTSAPS